MTEKLLSTKDLGDMFECTPTGLRCKICNDDVEIKIDGYRGHIKTNHKDMELKKDMAI
jgi:hypothetical protein